MSKSQKQDTQKQDQVAWSQHEHVAPPVQTHAQKLLQEAGSPELAHLAVEKAADESVPAQPGPDLDQLARRWKFATGKDLLAASIQFTSPAGDAWWLTQISDGKWFAWNDRDRTMSDELSSVEEARQFVAVAGDSPE